MPFLGCVYDVINVSIAPVQAGMTVGSVLFWPVPFLGFISGRSLLHVSEVASQKSRYKQCHTHSGVSSFLGLIVPSNAQGQSRTKHTGVHADKHRTCPRKIKHLSGTTCQASMSEDPNTKIVNCTRLQFV